MLTSARQFPFMQGDELRVYYPDIGLWHKGIVVEVIDGPHGWPSANVIHNSKQGGGVCLVSLEEFSNGYQVELSNRPWPGIADLVVSRAQSLLGQPYNALLHNCEHFTTWAYTGIQQSEQLQRIGWLTALGVVAVGLVVSDSGDEHG